MEDYLVWGTWALVVVALALVGVTFWMARDQSRNLKAQTDSQNENFHHQMEALHSDLRLRLQLTFMDRFDNDRMKAHRKALAEHLLTHVAPDQIQERVMDFFEDMGLFLRRGYLDEELLWSTFGFYAVRWWAASRDYISEEQRRKNDTTLFTEFKNLVERFRKRDAEEDLEEPTPQDLTDFLKDERDLT